MAASADRNLNPRPKTYNNGMMQDMVITFTLREFSRLSDY